LIKIYNKKVIIPNIYKKIIMGCGVYKIKNLIDGKVYVGSSVNIENREYKHFWMLNRGTHDNQHLQNAFNKFGKESFKFDIIEECASDNLIDKQLMSLEEIHTMMMLK
jgi:group I intron endonuclease